MNTSERTRRHKSLAKPCSAGCTHDACRRQSGPCPGHSADCAGVCDCQNAATAHAASSCGCSSHQHTKPIEAAHQACGHEHHNHDNAHQHSHHAHGSPCSHDHSAPAQETPKAQAPAACGCSSHQSAPAATNAHQNCGHDHDHSHKTERAHAHHDHDHDSSCSHDHSAPMQELDSSQAAASGQWFRIMEMDCVVEESEIRRALEGMAGIKQLQFALPQRALRIDADAATMQQALAAIRRIGYAPNPLAATASSDSQLDCAACDLPAALPSRNVMLLQMGAALAMALVAEIIDIVFDHNPPLPWRVTGMTLAVLAIGLSGFSTYRKGLQSLLRGKLNINTLMTVAVTGAVVIGRWPEAAMVMALYTVAEWIEGQAADRARNAIKALMVLTPEHADVQQPDGQWLSMPVASIQPGAVLRVKAGERIALDGIVTDGNSAVDQASVTGESIPVDKAAGDTVYAGTINGTGLLQVRSTAHASETMLARIIEAVERAQASRAPVQAFVDRFAAVYTPAMFALSCSVAVGGALLLGWPWLDAIYKALVVLVISCPCALVMSTPVTIVSALASAARRGILIKGGRYLEQARTLKTIAFDKTGTLTIGKPELVDVLLPGTQEHILPTALVLAAQSDHPVSQAIAQGLRQQGTQALPDHALQAVTAVPGRGMTAQLPDGTVLLLGHERWLQEQGIATSRIAAHIATQQAQGHTVTLLAAGQEAVAVFAVADTVKDNAQEALADLQKLGITTVMLSGDHAATAAAVAAQLGIAQVHGELLPEHKLDAITGHQRQGATGMVGDGINDAPALAQADIGFAMGAGGTHIAVEAADIVIMGDDLRRIPETISLSRKAYAVLWQNISIALGFKSIFFVAAMMGKATMWMAVFADIGTTLIVIANSLRMLRWRK